MGQRGDELVLLPIGLPECGFVRLDLMEQAQPVDRGRHLVADGPNDLQIAFMEAVRALRRERDGSRKRPACQQWKSRIAARARRAPRSGARELVAFQILDDDRRTPGGDCPAQRPAVTDGFDSAPMRIGEAGRRCHLQRLRLGARPVVDIHVGADRDRDATKDVGENLGRCDVGHDQRLSGLREQIELAQPPPQCLFGRDPRAAIASDHRRSGDAPLFVANRRNRHRDGDHPAILRGQLGVERRDVVRPLQQLRHLRRLAARACQQRIQHPVAHLAGLVAEQPLRAGVPRNDQAVQVAADDRVARRIDNRCQARNALLHLDLLADVGQRDPAQWRDTRL